MLHNRVKRPVLKCLNSIFLIGASSPSFPFLTSKIPYTEICPDSWSISPWIMMSTTEPMYLISRQIESRFSFQLLVSMKSLPDWVLKPTLHCKRFWAGIWAPREGRRQQIQAGGTPSPESLPKHGVREFWSSLKGLIFIFRFCFRFWEIISIITFFPVQRFLMHVLFILGRSFMLLCEFQLLWLILISFKALGHFCVGVQLVPLNKSFAVQKYEASLPHLWNLQVNNNSIWYSLYNPIQKKLMEPKAWGKACLTLVRTTHKRVWGMCLQKAKLFDFQFILLLPTLDAYQHRW